MGLFSNLFKSVESDYKYAPKNEREAWCAILYSVMSVDGDVSDIEIDSVARMLLVKKMFNEVAEIGKYFTNAKDAIKRIGNKSVIDASVNLVEPENKATLFTMVMELVMADGVIDKKEEEIIEVVAPALGLDTELAKKIVEVIMIKNKGNRVF